MDASAELRRLATPNFLLALILMYLAFTYFGWSPGGLFSREYLAAAWSFGRVVDLIKHLPIPLIVIGTAGTAGTAEVIRILRGSLLDELSKQYVITARSKGMQERAILFTYPVRVALNPIISTVGGLLPAIISGETLTAIVLSLPTIGPLLLAALRGPDMYLAGGIVDAARRAHPSRHADLRPAAGGDRSAHPFRGAGASVRRAA